MIRGFSVNVGPKQLFTDATLRIQHGQKYGLLGPNGHGKTTLLKMLAARELTFPPAIDTVLVEQDCVADGSPAIDAVLAADVRRTELLAREETLQLALAVAEDDAHGGGHDGDDSDDSDSAEEETTRLTSSGSAGWGATRMTSRSTSCPADRRRVWSSRSSRWRSLI